MKNTHTSLLSLLPVVLLLNACGPGESPLEPTDTTAASLQRHPVQLRYAALLPGDCNGCLSWSGSIELTSLNWQKDVSVVWHTPTSGGLWGPWRVTKARYLQSTPSGSELWSFEGVGSAAPTEMSVLYHVNGQDYWDDNGGAYYRAMSDQSPMGPGVEVAVVDVRGETYALTVEALVRNRAYEKSVSLVYSLDDWRTVQTAALSYQQGGGNGGERWQVRVPVRGTAKVDFAVVVRQAGREAWDNNFGRNFTCNAGPYGGWFCNGTWRD